MPFIGAGVYGAVRQKMSRTLDPITQKVPFGNMADEIVMLGANYMIGKFVGRKIPAIRSVTKAGMLIESARIGETLAQGQFMNSAPKLGNSIF